MAIRIVRGILIASHIVRKFQEFMMIHFTEIHDILLILYMNGLTRLGSNM